MSYAKFELKHYKKLTEDSWSSDYDILNAGDVDLKEGIEATKDTFKFSVLNAQAKYKDTFGLDDKIALYMWRNKESSEATDLAMDGMITEIKQKISADGRKISINGANRTQYLLGSLVQIPFVLEDHKCYEAIQEVIKKVNNNNFATEGHDKFIDYTTYVQTTKADGSDFPDKSFIWTYKPAYKAIEEWSADDYTEDGGYIFWVDTDGKFHWQSKPDTSSYSLTEGDSIINLLDIQQGSWDIFNAVIVSVGRDCYGHGNHILQYNPYSMVDVGTKWKFINWDSITPDLINAEVGANPGRFNLGDDGEVEGDMFPIDYASPTQYEIQFYKLDNNYELVEPNSKEVNSDAEFNLQIRRKARKIGKTKAKVMLDKRGEVRYKSNIEVNGTLGYVKGNMLTLTVPSHNLEQKKVRIMDIQHRFDNAGWTTKLKCEEDLEFSEEV